LSDAEAFHRRQKVATRKTCIDSDAIPARPGTKNMSASLSRRRSNERLAQTACSRRASFSPAPTARQGLSDRGVQTAGSQLPRRQRLDVGADWGSKVRWRWARVAGSPVTAPGNQADRRFVLHCARAGSHVVFAFKYRFRGGGSRMVESCRLPGGVYASCVCSQDGDGRGGDGGATRLG
jgi:hypothetical protein